MLQSSGVFTHLDAHRTCSNTLQTLGKLSLILNTPLQTQLLVAEQLVRTSLRIGFGSRLWQRGNSLYFSFMPHTSLYSYMRVTHRRDTQGYLPLQPFTHTTYSHSFISTHMCMCSYTYKHTDSCAHLQYTLTPRLSHLFIHVPSYV